MTLSGDLCPPFPDDGCKSWSSSGRQGLITQFKILSTPFGGVRRGALRSGKPPQQRRGRRTHGGGAAYLGYAGGARQLYGELQATKAGKSIPEMTWCDGLC